MTGYPTLSFFILHMCSTDPLWLVDISIRWGYLTDGPIIRFSTFFFCAVLLSFITSFQLKSEMQGMHTTNSIFVLHSSRSKGVQLYRIYYWVKLAHHEYDINWCICVKCLKCHLASLKSVLYPSAPKSISETGFLGYSTRLWIIIYYLPKEWSIGRIYTSKFYKGLVFSISNSSKQ